MSKYLRKVPLDFNWPLKKAWDGYINPHYVKCPFCEKGYSVGGEWFDTWVECLFYPQTELKKERSYEIAMLTQELTCKYCREDKNELIDFILSLFPLDQEQVIYLVDILFTCEDYSSVKKNHNFNYCSSDIYSLKSKIIEFVGLQKNWGICPSCLGDCIHSSVKEKFQEWKKFDPPTGEGYQLWDNVSEDYPVTPVFKTLWKLCVWSEKNVSVFGTHKMISAGNWERMILDGVIYYQEGNKLFL